METRKIKLEREGKVFIPVKEYANRHGITVQAVYQKLKKGKLKGKKIGSYQLIEL